MGMARCKSTQFQISRCFQTWGCVDRGSQWLMESRSQLEFYNMCWSAIFLTLCPLQWGSRGGGNFVSSSQCKNRGWKSEWFSWCHTAGKWYQKMEIELKLQIQGERLRSLRGLFLCLSYRVFPSCDVAQRRLQWCGVVCPLERLLSLLLNDRNLRPGYIFSFSVSFLIQSSCMKHLHLPCHLLSAFCLLVSKFLLFWVISGRESSGRCLQTVWDPSIWIISCLQSVSSTGSWTLITYDTTLAINISGTLLRGVCILNHFRNGNRSVLGEHMKLPKWHPAGRMAAEWKKNRPLHGLWWAVIYDPNRVVGSAFLLWLQSYLHQDILMLEFWHFHKVNLFNYKPQSLWKRNMAGTFPFI